MSASHAQTRGAPLDAVLDHVARHELNATLEVFGKLVLGPVQVPDECLEGVQLPEEVLRCPRAITVNDPNTDTGQKRKILLERRVQGLGCGGLWQVRRRMLFLYTWTQSNCTQSPYTDWSVSMTVCSGICGLSVYGWKELAEFTVAYQ